MDLYQFPQSHFCAKTRIVLLEKNISFDTPPIPGGSTRSSEFLALNPLGKTPVLVDSGKVICESEVIVEYLEECFPEPALLPSDPHTRAKSRFLSRVHDLHIAPVLSTLYFALSGKHASEVGKTAEELVSLLGVVDEMISPDPFLLGAKFYLCDATYAVSTWYAGLLLNSYGKPTLAEIAPKLDKWYAIASTRTSVAEALNVAAEAL